MAKISVYDKSEISFVHNGIILSDAISCTVEEELNGKYVLELVYPIDEKGKWEYLVEENIIKADGQLFRIHSTESNLGYIYVYTRHIFYDLLHNFLEDVRPTNLNGAGALNWILTNTQYPHNFIGMSDIDTLNTQYYIRKNPVEAMLGVDSLATRWNGELVRDNYTIRLLRQRGQNKGSQIAYGKNMLGLEVKRDIDTVITRIMPIGREGLLLPEKYIDSPLIDNYTFPHIRKVEFDIGIDEDTTEEQAFQKLRQGANNLYSINKVDIPYININTNLLLLENTEEYKHMKNLVKVELGDIVSCTDNPLKITFEAKVIRIKKDVLSNKNVEVELGQFKKGISNTIQSAINEVSEELKKNTSDLEKAIERATELLTNALGGYVVKRPGELLIMDTEDINTATKVWRWNLNGLGYSDVGINGPYRLAMTMDGKINADFITTGTLNAGIIKTGTLISKDGKTWINMDDGSFNFKDELKWDNATKKLLLGPNSQISWDNVTNQPNITQITKDTITTAYVNALDVTAKEVKSDWVYAGNIKVTQLLMGGDNGVIKWVDIDSKPTDLVTDSKLTTELGKDYIITGKIKANQLVIGGANGNISFDDLSNKPIILTELDITTITEDTISTTNILAQNLKVKSANIDGEIVAGSLKTTATIDVGTDAKIGNILYLGSQTATTLKGIYFANNSSITNTNEKMSIYARQGFDIYSNNGNLTLGTRYNSGYSTVLTGAKVIINTQTSTINGPIEIISHGFGNITLSTGTTSMVINGNGIDFKNSNIYNFKTPIPDYIKDKNDSVNNIEFRTFSTILQYKKSNSSVWYNIERPSSVLDNANTSYGIEFRFYNNKLQYKRSNTSTWIDII